MLKFFDNDLRHFYKDDFTVNSNKKEYTVRHKNDVYQVPSPSATRCVKRNCNKVLNIITPMLFASSRFPSINAFLFASNIRAIRLMRSHFLLLAKECKALYLCLFACRVPRATAATSFFLWS